MVSSIYRFQLAIYRDNVGSKFLSNSTHQSEYTELFNQIQNNSVNQNTLLKNQKNLFRISRDYMYQRIITN